MNGEKRSLNIFFLAIAVVFTVLVTVSCSIGKIVADDGKEFVLDRSASTKISQDDKPLPAMKDEQSVPQTAEKNDTADESEKEKQDRIDLSDFEITAQNVGDYEFSVVNAAVSDDTYLLLEVKTEPNSILTVDHGENSEDAKVGEKGKLIFTSLFVPEDVYTVTGTTKDGDLIGSVTLKFKAG